MTNQRITIPAKRKGTRRGVYLPGDHRREIFALLRGAGYTLRETAKLLRYTIREAYDLHPELNEAISTNAAYLEFLNFLKNGKAK